MNNLGVGILFRKIVVCFFNLFADDQDIKVQCANAVKKDRERERERESNRERERE